MRYNSIYKTSELYPITIKVPTEMLESICKPLGSCPIILFFALRCLRVFIALLRTFSRSGFLANTSTSDPLTRRVNDFFSAVANAMACSGRFTYRERLEDGEIRVLKVFAGEFREPIRCSLEVESLGDTAYEALSYTWGDPTPCEQIWINDQSCPVTKSLHEALQYLRDVKDFMRERSDIVLRLWVDAVCINQKDIREKGEQVEIMGSIYLGALRTYVWLGMPTPGLEHALDSLAKLTEQALTREAILEHGECIREVFIRAWFFRLWTFQEVVLSWRCTILIGRSNCKINVLFDLSRALHDVLLGPKDWHTIDPEHAVPGEIYSGEISSERVMDTALELNTTLDVIESTRHDRELTSVYLLLLGSRRLCSDPRDHIFALRGIEERMQESARKAEAVLSVDVNYSQDVADLFTRITTQCLLRSGEMKGMTQALSVLKNWGHSTNLQAWQINLPSWVPDWTCRTRLSEFPGEIYFAGGSERLDISTDTFSNDGKRLKLCGCSFDSIEDVYTVDKLPSGTEEHFIGLEDWALGKQSDTLADLSALFDALGRTLIVDMTTEADLTAKRWPQRDQRLACKPWRSWTVFREESTAQSVEVDNGAVPKTREYMRQYQKSMHSIGYGRGISITTSGHFALSSPGLQHGDEVVVFPGVSMPYILRRQPDATTYQLIGPAYVHGCMDGEVMERHSRGEYQLRSFVIC